MARAARSDSDWEAEIRDDLREPTDEELARMTEVLRRASKLRRRTNIAPFNTCDLVRAVRDEQDEN